MDYAGCDRRQGNNGQIARHPAIIPQSQLCPIMMVDVNAPDGSADRQSLAAVAQEEAVRQNSLKIRCKGLLVQAHGERTFPFYSAIP